MNPVDSRMVAGTPRLETSSGDDQPYWDIITLLDFAGEDSEPDEWSPFESLRFERYLEGVLPKLARPSLPLCGDKRHLARLAVGACSGRPASAIPCRQLAIAKRDM